MPETHEPENPPRPVSVKRRQSALPPVKRKSSNQAVTQRTGRAYEKLRFTIEYKRWTEQLGAAVPPLPQWFLNVNESKMEFSKVSIVFSI